MKTGNFVYDLSNETFNSEMYDTREEAIKAGKEDLVGESFYTGEVIELDKSWLKRNVCSISIEQFEENMEQELGYVAEDWLKNIDEEDFYNYLTEYFYKKHKPTFYSIGDIEKHENINN